MRTQEELNEALLVLSGMDVTPVIKAQLEVIEGKRSEAWVFDRYVKNVPAEEKSEEIFYAARDAARYVAGSMELDELVPDIELTSVSEEETVEADGLIGKLLHRIERLERQVKILTAMLQPKKEDYSGSDFMTQADAYQYIGCAQCTIMRWTKKGVVKGYRRNRNIYYKKSELDTNPVVKEYMENRKKQ